MVEYDERKWFLDSVGPELAHVMVIAVIKEMDLRNGFRAVITAVVDAVANINAFGTAFGVVD